VRQFGYHLQAAGHRCQLVALADRFISVPVRDVDDRSGCEVVRLPRHQWQRGETGFAGDAVAAFSPDWVSLQMVCYAYAERGLLLGQTAQLVRFGDAARRHLMFHELWIGESQLEGVKARSVGWLQRQLLLRLAARWAAHRIHTSNEVYRELLARHGVAARVLPLPGNIPVAPVDPALARRRLLQRLGISPLLSSRVVVAGVFGSIHPEWCCPASLARLEAACRLSGRELSIVRFGRAGASGEQVWQNLQRTLSDRMKFVALGELPPVELSHVLGAVDFGISTSPWAVVYKSGSVAAMIEHGTPVLVTRDDFRLRHGCTPSPEPNPLLHRLDDAFCALLAAGGSLHSDAQVVQEPYASFVAALDPQHARLLTSTPAATTDSEAATG
jgi:hypothetical protein